MFQLSVLSTAVACQSSPDWSPVLVPHLFNGGLHLDFGAVVKIGRNSLHAK